MKTRKILLLVSTALAAVALAVPASASALSWTDSGTPLGAGETAKQAFEGFMGFTVPKPPLPVHSTFECQVTIEIEAEGANGGKVLKFNPTTSTCEGTGSFAKCKLEEDSSNIGEGWNISVGTDIVVKHANAGQNLKIRYAYDAGCAIAESNVEWASMTFVPTLNGEGRITTLTVSGTSTTGFTQTTGAVTPEAGLTLGFQ